ncbi:MAG: hypothetical protein B7Z55_03600, partial [Planctomycetales bacterium 12-60-4]
RAVGESGKVILPVLYDATAGAGAGSRTEPIAPWLAKHFLLPEWNDLGVVNLSADRDQILRRQTLWTDDPSGPVPHFSLAILGRHRQWDDPLAGTQSLTQMQRLPTQVIVNYAGPAGTIPMVSFRDVLAAAQGARVDPEFDRRWQDQMVLIGTTDLSLGDRHLSPYSRRPPVPLWGGYGPQGERTAQEDEWMAGVELQANIVATLYDEAWLRTLPTPLLAAVWMLPLGGVLGWIGSRGRLPVVLSVIFVTQGLWWCLTASLFQWANVAVPVVGTWLVCIAAPAVVLLWRSGQRSQQKAPKLTGPAAT